MEAPFINVFSLSLTQTIYQRTEIKTKLAIIRRQKKTEVSGSFALTIVIQQRIFLL